MLLKEILVSKTLENRMNPFFFPSNFKCMRTNVKSGNEINIPNVLHLCFFLVCGYLILIFGDHIV